MHRLLWCGLLGLLWVYAARAQETSVPLDSTGKIFVIDAELERKLGLFSEYSGFIEARLYQSPDSSFTLEIIQQQDSSVTRTRVPRTAAEVHALRVRVAQQIAFRSPQSMYSHEGRGGLLVNSAILSTGFYGWAVPLASDADGSGFAGLYFFISAAGVLAPYFATENADITRATAMMDFYGASRGIVHGIAFYYFLDPQEDSDRAPYGWAAAFSIGERLALNQWAAHTHMSDGKAAVLGVGGDVGMVMSGFLASGHDLWNSEHQAEAGGLVLAGSGLGLLLGNYIAGTGDYSRGDAYVLRGATALGAGIPAAIADLARADGQTTADLAAAGSLAGIAIGHQLLRDMEFSRSQGLTVLMVEIAVATLVTSAVVTTEPEESSPYSMAAAIGGTAGFALGFANAQRSSRVLPKQSHFDVDFNPFPLFAQSRAYRSAQQAHQAQQAVTITYRF